jgi:hypothetical protein
MRKYNCLRGIIVLFAFLVLMSCNKQEHNNLCNVSNPIEDIAWLKAEIEKIQQNTDNDKYSYWMTATLHGNTVFFYGNCDPASNYISVLINCKGEMIGKLNDYADELTDVKLFWKPKDSACH